MNKQLSVFFWNDNCIVIMQIVRLGKNISEDEGYMQQMAPQSSIRRPGDMGQTQRFSRSLMPWPMPWILTTSKTLIIAVGTSDSVSIYGYGAYTWF